MDYDSFFNAFFEYLKKNNNKCINLLKENKDIIELYLSKDSNPKTVDNFIVEFKTIILSQKKNKYLKLYKSVLTHDNLSYVYSKFKKCDILIQAYKQKNYKLIEWLLTMNIDPSVQDTDGMSALMYSAKIDNENTFKSLVKNNLKCITQEDNEGNTILYHALSNKANLVYLLSECYININHLNHKHETPLLYCCKYKIYHPISFLTNKYDFHNLNYCIPDEKGKTAAMYLIENNRISELWEFCKLRQNTSPFDYVNEHGESVLSMLIKRMYGPDSSCTISDYEFYSQLIIYLIRANTNFNVVVDKDGNTAIMAILLSHDIETFKFVSKYSSSVDFSIKNNHGENATSLLLKYDTPLIKKEISIINQNTFDFQYTDPINGNTALILGVINQPNLIEPILQNSHNINEINSRHENALLIAARMNKFLIVLSILNLGGNPNQQDVDGNTALHFAILNRNINMIRDLVKYGADIDITNNENESPMKMAKDFGYESIIKSLLDPSSSLKSTDDLDDIKPNICNPHIDEYLYNGNSTLYQNYFKEGQNDPRTKALQTTYLKHIEKINSYQRQIKYALDSKWISLNDVPGGTSLLSYVF